MTTSSATHGGRIGLIAGNGRFPIIFADNARKLGYHVSAVAHEGETEPELAGHVDRIHWIKIGQLNKLIKAFKELTGCGVIINTSFNVRGEPIVCTPHDAYLCFMRTNMDHLVLGHHLLDKKEQPPLREDVDWRSLYELD